MRVVTAVVVALVAGAAHARLGAEAPDGGGGSGADGAQGGAQGSPTPSGSGQVPAAQDPYAHERSHPEGAHVGPHYVEFVAAKTAPSDENPVDGYRPSYVRSGYFRERVEHERTLREARKRAVATAKQSAARRQICRLCMSTITMGRVLVEEERGLRDAENLVNLTATTCPLMKAQYGAFVPDLDCHSLLSRVQHYYDPRFEGPVPGKNGSEVKRVNFALVHLLHNCNTFMGIDFCPASEVTSDKRWHHWASFLGSDPFERAVAKAEAEAEQLPAEEINSKEPYLRDGVSPLMHPVEDESGSDEQTVSGSTEPAIVQSVDGSPTGASGSTAEASESSTSARATESTTEVVQKRHRTERKRVTVEEETLSPPAEPAQPEPKAEEKAKAEAEDKAEPKAKAEDKAEESQAPEAATGPEAEPEAAPAATAPAATAPAATAPAATAPVATAPAATAPAATASATGTESSGPEEEEAAEMQADEAEADEDLDKAQAKLDAMEAEEEAEEAATGPEETPAATATGTEGSTPKAETPEEEARTPEEEAEMQALEPDAEQGAETEEAEATAATGSTAEPATEEPSPAPAASSTN